MADMYISSSRSATYSSNYYPSFSSSLLDSIYRSIEVETPTDRNSFFNGPPPRTTTPAIDFAASRQRRAPLMTDAAAARMFRRNKKEAGEEDEENNHHPSVLKVKTACWEAPRPDPARIGQHPNKQEGGLLKTKSRALKMYGDLKKAKQPISPGKKLAGFLNSLFNNGGNALKKGSSKVAPPKDDYYTPSTKSTATTSSSSACSSASSFSRSCLSKTSSSTRKSAASAGVGGAKRSVKFSSVSMIIGGVEDDSRRKKPSAAEGNEAISRINEEIMVRVMEKNRRAEEDAAVDFLRSYQKSRNYDDDCASFASSDLFELDNLSSIGLMESGYDDDDELPVYESTHLQKSNRGGTAAMSTATAMVV